jgi:prolipoprotein diacylglyceryl transferase
MIDPVIFSVEIFGITLTLRWYGVIVMIGVVIGSLIVERELSRRGEKGDRIWDALIWVLPAGIIGARLWYVFNSILGGNRSYLDNPASILRVWEGGLHIFGGFLFGAAALLYYLRQNQLDPWLFLDAAGPAALVGQGIGRILLTRNSTDRRLHCRGESRSRQNIVSLNTRIWDFSLSTRLDSTPRLPTRCCGTSLRQAFCFGYRVATKRISNPAQFLLVGSYWQE